MPVALSYRRDTTASSSSGRAGRTVMASEVKRLERRPEAMLERRRLPAELALRPARVGPRVPHEEVELAAGEEGRPPDDLRQRLAGGRQHLGRSGGQPRGDATTTRDADHDLGHLLERRVTI